MSDPLLSTSAPSPAATAGPLRVLVLTDGPDTGQLVAMASQLEPGPAQVRVVPGPSALRDALAAQAIDVVIASHAQWRDADLGSVLEHTMTGLVIVGGPRAPVDEQALDFAIPGEVVLTPQVLQMAVDTARRLTRLREHFRDREDSRQFALDSAGIGDWDLRIAENATRRSLMHDRIFGYEELLPSWSYEDFLAHVHPDDRARVDGHYQAAKDAGGVYEVEFRIVWADGSVHWTLSRGRFYRNAAGELVRIAGIQVQITDRKLAEQRQAAREELLRALIQASPLATVALDASHQIVLWSRAAELLFGHREAEVLGQLLPIVPPEEPAIESAGADAPDGGGGMQGVGVVRRRADGSNVHLRLWRAPLRDPEGRIRGSVVVYQDLSEIRLLEEQARVSQRMESVGRLAGGIAHDFNNLLTAIIAGVSLLLARPAMEDEERAELQDILAAGRRAAELTARLLAFSRRQVLQVRSVDLNELVDGLARLLRRLLGDDVVMETSLTPGLPCIHADPGQLEQVLVNLAINARDAMPSGGRLTIATGHAPGGRVQLIVSDTGLGMTAETRAHLFEPFFTTKPLGKGTGLGLASAHGIVTQSGGTIEVESAPGEGASFTITLPGTTEPARPQVPVMASSDASAGQERILLAEDDEGVRRIAAQILSSRGYRVVIAIDGSEAMHMMELASQPFDLLVTDVVMAGVGGRRLAEHFAARYAGAPIVFISGFADDYAELASDLGSGRSFLPKPFTPEELLHSVATALGRRGQSPETTR